MATSEGLRTGRWAGYRFGGIRYLIICPPPPLDVAPAATGTNGRGLSHVLFVSVLTLRIGPVAVIYKGSWNVEDSVCV